VSGNTRLYRVETSELIYATVVRYVELPADDVEPEYNAAIKAREEQKNDMAEVHPDGHYEHLDTREVKEVTGAEAEAIRKQAAKDKARIERFDVTR
jgi:hypothetical protein